MQEIQAINNRKAVNTKSAVLIYTPASRPSERSWPGLETARPEGLRRWQTYRRCSDQGRSHAAATC